MEVVFALSVDFAVLICSISACVAGMFAREGSAVVLCKGPF